MKRILLTALSLTLVSGSALAQPDCRTIGAVPHCFNPPAPQPLTEEQKRALQEAIIAQDRAVLAPLASGRSVTSCAAAIRNAEQAKRWHLVKLVQDQCT